MSQAIPLYPEYSREELEMQYHLVTAALMLAAQERRALGGGATGNAGKQIDAWLKASEEMAVHSAMVRKMRNQAQLSVAH